MSTKTYKELKPGDVVLHPAEGLMVVKGVPNRFDTNRLCLINDMFLNNSLNTLRLLPGIGYEVLFNLEDVATEICTKAGVIKAKIDYSEIPF